MSEQINLYLNHRKYDEFTYEVHISVEDAKVAVPWAHQYTSKFFWHYYNFGSGTIVRFVFYDENIQILFALRWA